MSVVAPNHDHTFEVLAVIRLALSHGEDAFSGTGQDLLVAGQ